MADERLRRLERQAGAGDPEAETQLLLERVRTGELTRQGLEIAAFLGHLAARRALEDPPEPLGPTDLHLVYGLDRWGKAPLVRSAIAVGHLALEALAVEDSPLDPGPAWDAVAAAEDWVRCECEAHRVAARLAGDAAKELGDRMWQGEVLVEEVYELSRVAELVARTAEGHDLDWAKNSALLLVRECQSFEIPPDRMEAVIRRDLLAWALGSDPLA